MIKLGNEIIALFEKLAREGKTIIMVTHNTQLAERAHRVIEIQDGNIKRDGTDFSKDFTRL